MKDILIEDRYRIDARIAKGGFGLVYSGTDMKLHEEVAIKLSSDDDDSIIGMEAHMYRELSGGVGIPRMLWYGGYADYYCLVSNILGPSLEDLLNYCQRRFSLKTILLIADQAISRIKFVHDRGYIHRDIKPENLLMGTGRTGNVLYIIDFGFCCIPPEQEPDSTIVPFIGTRQFASIRAHAKNLQTWASDLESLGYVLIYLANGSLPWDDLEYPPTKEEADKMFEAAKNVPAASLCEGLPKEFATYLDYTRSLPFGARPDYEYLRKLFRRLFAARGFHHDNIYDWTERLFNELRSQQGEAGTQSAGHVEATAPKDDESKPEAQAPNGHGSEPKAQAPNGDQDKSEAQDVNGNEEKSEAQDVNGNQDGSEAQNSNGKQSEPEARARNRKRDKSKAQAPPAPGRRAKRAAAGGNAQSGRRAKRRRGA